MSSTITENNYYWPSFIEQSKSLFGIVISDKGKVFHANNKCKNQLAEHVDTCDCSVIIFNEKGERLKPGVSFENQNDSDVIVSNLKIWIQCQKYCIDFGFKWELSAISINGERFYTAIASDILIDAHVKQKYETLTKEKESLHSTYRSLAGIIPGFVFQFEKKNNGELCFPFISSGFGKMLGVTAEELQESASPILRLIHPEDKSKLEKSVEISAEHLSNWNLTFRFLCPSLEIKWVQGIAVPERTNINSVVWRGFIYDISERVKNEQRLKRQQSELDEIAFLQAHEFRRPLANMLSLFDMIELQGRDSDSIENILELLDMLKKSVKEADAVIAKIVSKTNNSKWLISKQQG